MSQFILRRFIQALVSMFIVTVFVFGIVRLSGDPLQLILPEEAPPEKYEEMARLLYLDKPIHVQYLRWMSGVLKGDFGTSTRLQVPVSTLIGEGLPNTIQLTAVAFVFTLVVGLTVGIYAAANRGSRLDVISRSVAIIGMAVPNFWLGIILIMIFAVYLGWLPAGGKGDWTSVILPALTLGTFPVAGLMRLTRSSMIEVLDSEYVKLARIKGVKESLVLWKHAFKNAALPVLTFASLYLVLMLRGSVITETVFAWPGIGRLVLDAILNRDFPVVQAVVLMFSSWFIFSNLLLDVLYAYVNPKIRFGRGQ